MNNYLDHLLLNRSYKVWWCELAFLTSLFVKWLQIYILVQTKWKSNNLAQWPNLLRTTGHRLWLDAGQHTQFVGEIFFSMLIWGLWCQRVWWEIVEAVSLFKTSRRSINLWHLYKILNCEEGGQKVLLINNLNLLATFFIHKCIF